MSNIGSVAMPFAFKPANNMYSGFKTPSSSKGTNYGSSSFTPNTKSSGAYEKVCAFLLLIGILLLVIVPFISFLEIKTGQKHYESVSVFSLVFDESISIIDIIKAFADFEGMENFLVKVGCFFLPFIGGFYFLAGMYSLIMSIIAFLSRSYVLLKKTAVFAMGSLMTAIIAVSILSVGQPTYDTPYFFEMTMSLPTIITFAVVSLLFGFVAFYSAKKNIKYIKANNANLFYKHIPIYVCTTLVIAVIFLFKSLSGVLYDVFLADEYLGLTIGVIILMPGMLFKLVHDFCASFKAVLVYSHMSSVEQSAEKKINNVNLVASIVISILTFFVLTICESVRNVFNFGILVLIINAALMIIAYILYSRLDKKY